ncbi:MAG: succinate dehydrogenase flavoprotein subunit [Phycisphaeraceae bacterium]|nr:MAG: succinate dehydrogenase flavoprotein subunit [Phycisphaeraceae bacterium]
MSSVNPSSKQRVIVVGGGLAGLAAAARLVEQGLSVDLFSMVPVKRSHSVCAQGGINACNEIARQQGFSEWMHMDETLYGGDFLADQPPVYEMTHWAPKIIDLLDRMGVPFNRTGEGYRDLRLFGGSLFKRTHFAGATTGQQLMYALDEQVRRHEAEGKVVKYEFWEFLWPVIEGEGDERRCVGIVAQDLRTMQIRAFPADAVAMATGGCGLVFGKSTNSVMCTGGAASRCYQAGAWYANGEFIQVHPTAIPGADKCRLMSESARGEGGRVWVPRKKGDNRDPRQIDEKDRWYFLEEKYPKYGNLVPRDIATREIFDVCVNQGLGVKGENQVYLDLSFKPREELDRKLKGILEIYEKFAGEDPREVPMRIFPAVHYSMGGLWTTFTSEKRRPDPVMDLDSGLNEVIGLKLGAPDTMATNIPGLYALGEVNFAYHGGTRLGANALLSCIFDGLFAGVGIANYAAERADAPASDIHKSVYDGAVKREEEKVKKFIGDGASGAPDTTTNPYEIAKEMGDEMTAASTVVKTEERMLKAMDKLHELQDRISRARLSDNAMWTNQNLSFTRAVSDMLILAEAILAGGIERKESRGSHHRSDYPDRDDANFLKTTIAEFDPDSGRPKLSWREVHQGLAQPRVRSYGKIESAAAKTDTAPQVAASAAS